MSVENSFAASGMEKFRLRETPNLSTDADSSTDICVSAGVKKKLWHFFFVQKKKIPRRHRRCRRLPRDF